MKGKYWVIWGTAVLLILLTTQWVWGFPIGITGYSGNPATGGSTCNNCHNGGIVPTVTITGPTAVPANTIATYMLTISGGQEIAGGLDVSATDGLLDILPGATDTRLFNSEITHTEPKTADTDGTVTFSFQWQAPETVGKVTLYGAGNSVNLMNGSSGDAASSTTLAITVVAFTEKIYLPTIMRSDQE
jgi:hypothetical protein